MHDGILPSPHPEELSVRRFSGNGMRLCAFRCPHQHTVEDGLAYCSLFKRRLNYYETGNNDICERCEECISAGDDTW